MMRFLLMLLFISSTACLNAQNENLSDSELIQIFTGIKKSDNLAMKSLVLKDSVVQMNFNTIIDLIKKQGFPQLEQTYRRKKKNNCVESATQITFIHILQIKASLILNNGTIDLLKTEMDNKRMPKRILEVALHIYTCDLEEGRIAPLNEKSRFYLDHAYSEWNIDPSHTE